MPVPLIGTCSRVAAAGAGLLLQPPDMTGLLGSLGRTQQMVPSPTRGSRRWYCIWEGCRAGPISPGYGCMTLVMSLVTSALLGGAYSQPYNVLETRKAPRGSPGWWLCLLVGGQALGLPSQPVLCSLAFCCPQHLWLKGAAFLSGSAPQRVYHPTQRQGWGSISISWGAAMLLEAFWRWRPAKPPAGAAWGAEHVPPHRPLGWGGCTGEQAR